MFFQGLWSIVNKLLLFISVLGAKYTREKSTWNQYTTKQHGSWFDRRVTEKSQVGHGCASGGVLEMQVMMGLDSASHVIIKLTSYSWMAKFSLIFFLIFSHSHPLHCSADPGFFHLNELYHLNGWVQVYISRNIHLEKWKKQGLLVMSG